MSEQKQIEIAKAAFEMEISRLKALEGKAASRCDAAKLIAVRDEEVVETLFARLRNGDIPLGARCLAADTVLFAFTCPPGTICIVPRSFAVQVDLTAGTVEDIRDPFDPDDSSVKASALTARSDSAVDTRIRVIPTPSGRVAPAPDIAKGTSAIGLAMTSEAIPADFESFTLTIEVPGVAFKAVLFGSTRFDFFGADRLDVTLPTAGTYQFDLMVRDFARRTFKFKISTSSGASLEQSAETDDQGANLLRLQVTVP